MSKPNENAYLRFFQIALEYYVNGRAACLCGCAYTTGNLMHHAVEMILKGELSRTVSLEELKNFKKFGHRLPKCWAAFKALFPTEDFAEFDRLIEELNKFETIRYPDKILAQGAVVGFGFGKWSPSLEGAINPVPQYRLAIGDVDAFFARIMPICHMNIEPYFYFLTPNGREMLLKHNDEAKVWFR